VKRRLGEVIVKTNRCFPLVAILLLLSLPAFAVLGGDTSTVRDDQARMMATRKVRETHTYAIHELTTATGIVIRQYVSPAGRVFGVSWSGAFMPDMSQLLGTYFSQFSGATRARSVVQPDRNHLVIRARRLVLESTGHMRAYSGRAYDPALLPEGVQGYDVR